MLLTVPPATAATVTASGGADSFSFSSPSSAESNFRQLDDVFLQTQTRIWLGEVLHMRFDEQLDISDLLSDGELLCEVSRILWDMLLAKFMEPRHVETHTQISNGSRKSSGRYMPYSNVDSFLKVCKVFGLDGIDLFSPSDVVEKRDTRKVCICIRSLSKKARCKQLNVPDFDIVTYTVAMPTDIVGCIRKSLEISRGRIISPVQSSCKDRKTGLTDPLELDLEGSAGVQSAINECKFPEDEIHIEVQEEADETEQCLYFSEHLPESVDSICFRYFSNLNSMSPPGYEPQIKVPNLNGARHGHESSTLDAIDIGRSEGNDASYHPIQLDGDSVSSSCMDNESYGSNSTPETSKYGGLSSYPDNVEDVEVTSKSSMSSLLSGRVLQFDFDAKCDEDDQRTTKQFCTEFPYYEAEGMENETAEIREVQDMAKFERPLHCSSLDKESHIGLELETSDLSVDSLLPYWHEKSVCSPVCRSINLEENRVGPTPRDLVGHFLANNTNLIGAVNDLELVGEVRDDEKTVMCSRLVDTDPDIKEIADIHLPVDCGNIVVDRTSKDLNCTCNCSAVEDDTHEPEADVLANQCESSAQKHPCSINKGPDDLNKSCHLASLTGTSRDLLPSQARQTNEDEKINCNDDSLGEERSDGKNDKRVVEKQNKGKLMGPLLKTVVKGTAFIGVMFLLHLRIRNDGEKKGKGGEQSSSEKKDEGGEDSTEKSSKEENDEGGKKSIPVQKSNGMRGSIATGVYPADKLNLGD